MRNTIWTAFVFVASVMAMPALAGKLLVVRADGREFRETASSLTGAVGSSHVAVDFLIDAKTTYADFADRVRKEKPDLLVLMDNRAVNFAVKFNAEPDAWARGLRGVATMALNLKKILKGNSNICGVAYEVPALSIMSSFRYVVDKSISSVLVLYRKAEFEEVIDDATRQLAREGITLVAKDVDAAGTTPEIVRKFIEDNLAETSGGKKYDAIWVMTDNVLLTPANFSTLWVPRSREMRIPFLCNIEKFATKEMDFCSFSMSPNNQDLGHQASEMVLSLLEDNEQPSKIGVDYVVSASQLLNRDKVERLGMRVRDDRLQKEPGK